MTARGRGALRDIARAQNDRDHAAGHLPSRYVEDPAVLAEVAAMLAEHNDAPGTWGPGRRDHPAAAKTKRGRSNATP